MIELETVSLFRDLTGRDMASLRRIATEKQFTPGQEIFREGDEGNGLYTVRDGLVEISGVVSQNVRGAVFAFALPLT
jgi:CRP-like cAMP-binding protein